MAGDEKRVKVKIDHVEKVYDGRKGRMVALNGVDLDIMENEFICVVGPSGCGKSTLLNIIAGLLQPTSGAVYVDGKKVEGTGTERGVVFQQYALFPWLTVLKNVMFGLKLKGMKDDEARELAMKYIDGSAGGVCGCLSKGAFRRYEAESGHRKSVCGSAGGAFDG